MRSWPRAGAAARGPSRSGRWLGRPASTVGKVLRRRGQSRRPRLPRPPVVRYERASPGELLHLDTKKLGRFWHVGKRITRDGVTRSPRRRLAARARGRRRPLAPGLCRGRPSDRQGDALAFLDRALAWFRAQGIVVRAVMTDNGPAYRSHAWRRRCAARDLRHLRTRPYTPRTNGKAERLIQILLRSWAYAFAYPSSAHRTRALIRLAPVV